MKELFRLGLTNLPQPPYARGGDIFMATEGNQDMAPKDSQPTGPEHAEGTPLQKQPVSAERQAAARRAWERSYGGNLSKEVGERGIIEHLIREGKPPIAGGTTGAPPGGEPPKAPPLGEDQPKEPNNQNENQLNPADVDTTEVADPELKKIGERMRIRLERNLMDYREVEKNIQDMEAALRSLPAGSPDLGWARNLYGKLYDEVVRQRQLAGEVNWEVVKEQLLNATRTGDLKTIEDIVRKNYDFNERINVHDLVEVSLSDEAIEGGTYGYALEYVLESIINVADLTPLGTIPNPTFVQSENIARLIKGTLDLDRDTSKTFYKYLKELQERRQLSHELYKSLSTKGAYEKYVGEHLKNDGFHYLENEIAGVSEVQGLWEKVMARKKSNKKEILSQEEFDEVHEEVRGLFITNANLDASGTSQKLNKEFTISVVNATTGKMETKDIKRPLRQWEIDRAAVVGRSIAHVSGRAITYGMLGDLPELGDDLWESMNAEYVARITGSMKVMARRFLAGGSSASKLYVERWVKNKKKIAEESGQIFGEGETSLYGQSLESAVYMDTGVPDLKSHSWRSRRTMLKNRKFAKIGESDANDSDKNTIGDYLDRKWKRVDNLKVTELDIELDSLGSLTKEEIDYLGNKKTVRISKVDRKRNILYSREIRDAVLNQRLYLGALLREGHFTPMLREEIWQKVSELLPSRIAAFFPEERKKISEIVVDGERHEVGVNDEEWKNISDKLFMAEMDRTREQAERVRNNDFTEVRLSDFYGRNGFTTKGEIAYIEEIIKLGQSKSKILSVMIFSQSAFLDDAPGPEWMNLGKETVGRLLVNDYEGYNTANNERNAIIANPSMRLEESAGHLIKAKDGYASPIGQNDAQERLEADVMTRYDMYAMGTSSKWGLYSVNRFLRKPTSPIERANVDANISMDEKAIFQDVDFLSQNAVVGNDRVRLDFLGHTQSERIKKKAKATLKAIWLRNLRLLIMLFPVAFSTEFIKMIAPDLLKTQ